MYVRFVVDEIDENSGVEVGIFQAMFRLWRAGQLHSCEEAWWEDIRWWFNRKLEEPDRFARSRRAGANACAISWFRATASGHIARAQEMVALLAEHYVPSRMLRTWRRDMSYTKIDPRWRLSRFAQSFAERFHLP